MGLTDRRIITKEEMAQILGDNILKAVKEVLADVDKTIKSVPPELGKEDLINRAGYLEVKKKWLG